VLVVEQLRAPSLHRAVALPNALFRHDAGWTMSSSLQVSPLPDAVRDGRVGSLTCYDAGTVMLRMPILL